MIWYTMDRCESWLSIHPEVRSRLTRRYVRLYKHTHTHTNTHTHTYTHEHLLVCPCLFTSTCALIRILLFLSFHLFLFCRSSQPFPSSRMDDYNDDNDDDDYNDDDNGTNTNCYASTFNCKGALGSVVGNPFDVLKTRMMTAEGTHARVPCPALYLLHSVYSFFSITCSRKLQQISESSSNVSFLYCSLSSSKNDYVISPITYLFSHLWYSPTSTAGLVQPSMGDAAKNLYKSQGTYCTVLCCTELHCTVLYCTVHMKILL